MQTPQTYAYLHERVSSYLNEEQVNRIYQAYLYAAEHHEGQTRKTGEAYIWHPVAVANILAELSLDTESIIACLLHDVIEDTQATKEDLVQRFGESVAEIVDGVSKLDKLEYTSPHEAQAASFRKMMFAMAKDIRVILIKLADRLHNMRTITTMRPDKRRRIAKETLEIYAPLAARLGINSIRLELDDLSFQAQYPMRYRILKNAILKAKGHRKEIIEKIQSSIALRLEQDQIHASVTGREKHLRSLYEKMRLKKLNFHEVLDLYAFRVHVQKPLDCYLAMGSIHSLYPPIPNRFKDYIAIPKTNGYQSLHTILVGPYGIHIEVQIRTEDMHRLAEHGVAAHWAYKTQESLFAQKNNAESRAQEWIKHLIELQKDTGDSLEFLENVKVDLFPQEIFVFTPKGDIMTMPKGATVLDFAYQVHTQLGHHCIGARINKVTVSPRQTLNTGETIEILTAEKTKPLPQWLEFASSARARSHIRQFLKNQTVQDAIRLGRGMLGQALYNIGLAPSQLNHEQLIVITESTHAKNLDELYYWVGIGDRNAKILAQQIHHHLQHTLPTEQADTADEPLLISEQSSQVLHYANCCHPIPGDDIVAVMSAGKGLVVHRSHCKNMRKHQKNPDSLVPIDWDTNNLQGDFACEILIENHNQRGVLAQVAATISKLDCNIDGVRSEPKNEYITQTHYTIRVKDRKHLADVLRALHRMPVVIRATRDKL